MTSSAPVNLDNLAEPSRWHCIYPIYINSEKSVKQGRRLPREKCVTQPLLQEIAELCQFLQLPYRPEVSGMTIVMSIYAMND